MRRKILIFSIVLIIVSVGVTSYISIRATIKNFEDVNVSMLTNYGNLINSAIAEDYANNILPDYSLFAQGFASQINERVTFIAQDGTVLADSSAGAAYINMDNHKYRTEVKQALTGNVGKSIRTSGTFNITYIYVAVPLQYKGEVALVTRIAMEINQVEIINDYIIKNSLMSALIGMILAILMSLLYSGRITRPVRTILTATSKIAEGNYDERIFVKSGDELEKIAEKINEMAEKLGHTIVELSDSNSKKLSVLYSMKEAIIAVDNEFKVILINNAAKSMFGLSDDSVGEYLLRTIRSSQLHETFKKVVSEKFIGEQEIEFPGGRIYKIKTVYITDERSGKQLGIMALIEDITEFKKMENIRKDFVANVSHELKTPLTSIAGFVETLQSGAADDPILRSRFLDIISIESARLKRLIEDILIISDIEGGREQRLEEKIDVKEEIALTINSIAPIIAEKGTVIIQEYDDEGIFITGNPDRFRQMMVNLIENAVKYSESGTQVRISAHRQFNRIHIVVEDQGYGISEEHLPRLFERFYRVDKSRSQMAGGTGLGLAIVKHIVHLFDGEIYVESKVGVGSVFTIII
jgi:two-component system phosphate regulon sensor histidine kinase PhoR